MIEKFPSGVCVCVRACGAAAAVLVAYRFFASTAAVTMHLVRQSVCAPSLSLEYNARVCVCVLKLNSTYKKNKNKKYVSLGISRLSINM